MANSKFDFSLLKPINQNAPQLNIDKLKPVNENYAGEYLDKLPNPEGFLSKLPRNILAGLAGLGHSTLNLPHDLVQGAENSLMSLGVSLNKAIPFPRAIQENLNAIQKNNSFNLSEHIPYQEDYNFAQMLGQKGEGSLMDNIIQNGLKYAPEIVGGRALIKAGLHKLPITKGLASRQLKEADKLVQNLSPPKIPLSQQTIDEALQFLPKTHASRELLTGAKSGEYNASFSLQSQIGAYERALRKSPLAAERLLAPQARDLKMRVIEEMETGLRSHGYNDIADLLKGGINDYRKYIQFRDKAFPIFKKIGIPTTGLALLGIGVKKGKSIASNLID